MRAVFDGPRGKFEAVCVFRKDKASLGCIISKLTALYRNVGILSFLAAGVAVFPWFPGQPGEHCRS